MIEQRWEVKIGSTVTTTDGDYGQLQQLVVDPQEQRVVSLLVQPRGWLPYHPVVVPENIIVEASENEVRLKLSREQAQALPEYLPDSESGLLLRDGQRVFCQDEYAGWVSLILLEPGGQVEGFVLRTGHLFGRNLIVPIASVHNADANYVYLSIEKQDLENLPDYRLDDALAAGVRHALWSDQVLRNTDYNEIGVSVQDGIVTLQGHVCTPINKARAESAIRFVVGVLGLENNLVIDQDLVIDVAQTLKNDERTRVERISVGAQNGFIKLNGRVGSAAIRDDAETIAASVPQVRGVVNFLHAPNVIIGYKYKSIRQPLIGQEVFAADMKLGHVERVVIDPRNRRVTAFVARGYFPDPEDEDGYRLPSDEPQEEHSVVIPMGAVSHVTDGSVLLGISGAETALHQPFEPDHFMPPPTGWQPPYPYRWDQVLFAEKRSEES